MSPAALFKRALAEKLAFTPMGPQGPQAAGPGGAPVGGPGAPPGGAPMDPGAAPPGGYPSAGAPPMDPSAMGAPAGPDPSGGAPMDPGAAPSADPMASLPPPPEAPPEAPPKDPVDEQVKARQQLGTDDAMVPLSQLKEFTVGVIEATKGKKTQEAAIQEAKEEAAQPPAQAPGPVTGMPGFDPSALGGPLKTAAVLKFLLKR